jgi:hypothetical protein
MQLFVLLCDTVLVICSCLCCCVTLCCWRDTVRSLAGCAGLDIDKLLSGMAPEVAEALGLDR